MLAHEYDVLQRWGLKSQARVINPRRSGLHPASRDLNRFWTSWSWVIVALQVTLEPQLVAFKLKLTQQRFAFDP